MITGPDLPRSLLGQLPSSLFQGKLLRNRFLGGGKSLARMPPRLPVLVALAAQRLVCEADQTIYEVGDHPSNLFLVLSGTFAYVAEPVGPVRKFRALKPHPSLKACMSPKSKPQAGPALFPFQLFSAGAYFGDVEIFLKRPRQATARSETEAGVALSVHANELKGLVEEFPEFGKKWHLAAWDHALALKQRQAKLAARCCFRHFAATAIQEHWRGQNESAQRCESPLTAAVSKLHVMKVQAEQSSLAKQEEQGCLSAHVDQLFSRMEALQETTAARVSQLCASMDAVQAASAAQVDQFIAKMDALQEAIAVEVGRRSARMDALQQAGAAEVDRLVARMDGLHETNGERVGGL